MNKKIAIIGSGSFGTAMAKVLYDGNNKNIVIYGIEQSELNDLRNGKNSKYFPNIQLPKFQTTINLQEAINGAKFIILATPSIVMNLVLPKVIQQINTSTLIINVAKGFYPGQDKSLHEGIVEISNNKNIRGVVSLIGPSHAEEIIYSMPTLVASVGFDARLCREVQKLFSTSYFKIYVQIDVKGAGVGAVYKNIIAIAAGMVQGLGYGFNTTAALLTRGMKEMKRFNNHMGGKTQTLYGLTGMGDLIVTATSPLSRNWTFGHKFIKSKLKSSSTNKTVEGLSAIKYVYKIGKDNSLDLPIAYALYSILFENQNYKTVFHKLWNRSFKEE